VSEVESQNGSGLGRISKFNGKEGKIIYNDGVEMPAGATYVATDVRIVWIKFSGDGTAPERVGDSLLSPDYKPRARETLGDIERAEWPLGKFSGAPEDPWQGEIVIVMRDQNTGETCSFVALSRSKSAASAAKAGALSIKNFCSANPDKLPIMRLGVSSYKHKKFGAIRKPTFEIVGSVSRAELPDVAEPAFPF
jgi:hypothetical protein